MISRRFILAFILIILTFLSAFMSYSSFAQEKDSNILSLKQAEDEAIKNSVILKESLRNIDSLSDEYEQAYDEERRIKKDDDSYISGTLEYFQYKSGYNSKKADIKINETKLKMKADEENIKLNVLNSYQDILLKQKEIEVSKENLEIEKKLLEGAKLKYSLGKISSYELEKVNNNYQTINLELNTQEQEVEDLYKKLNLLRGTSLEERPKLLMDVVSNYADELINPKDALEIAMKNRYDIVSLKNDLELADMDLKTTGNVYTDNTYKYKEKERIFNDSKEKYEEIKSSIKEEIENNYSSILTCKIKNDNITLSIDKIKKDIQQKESLFKYGRISEIEVRNAKKDLLYKEFEYMKNLFEYQKLSKTYILSYEFGK